VVLREGDGFAAAAEHRAGVTRISDEESGRGDEDDVGRAANRPSDVLSGSFNFTPFDSIADFIEAHLSFVRFYELINQFKGFVECFLVLGDFIGG
jgi:hypothetical protein